MYKYVICIRILLFSILLFSIYSVQYSYIVVQSLSSVQLFATPWTAACQASLSLTVSLSLLKLMSIESVRPSNHLILCHPLLPSVFPSIRVFSNELALCIRWPKYWSFSLNISPSNEHPGLISFRMDWLDLLAVQGMLKSLHQYHNYKALIFQHSACFMLQFSHMYMTIGKTIPLTGQNFVSKVISLLFNMLSSFVIGFLPRSKSLLMPWLQLPFTMIWESKKIASVTGSTFFPITHILIIYTYISSVQSLSHVQLFATPWTAATRLLYPSPTPRVYSNSCTLGW